jgi:hypothetical protein
MVTRVERETRWHRVALFAGALASASCVHEVTELVVVVDSDMLVGPSSTACGFAWRATRDGSWPCGTWTATATSISSS